MRGFFVSPGILICIMGLISIKHLRIYTDLFLKTIIYFYPLIPIFMIHLTEDILHYVWNRSLFDQKDLFTTDNEEILILKKGIVNKNSGPDFTDAKIKIGNTVWAGQVEMHIHSEDWFLHGHQTDPSYNNVILHVVYHHNKEVKINGQNLPVLVLNGRIPPSLFSKYKKIIDSGDSIPCKNQMIEVKEISVISQMEKAVADRLSRKSAEILQMHSDRKSDWEEITFRLLLFYMIGKVNRQPAEWLLNEIKTRKILQVNDSSFINETILLGTAGFLDENADQMNHQMVKEYSHQKRKWQLNALNAFIWKFGGIRPAQYPTVRLVQTAAISGSISSLFQFFIFSETKEIRDKLNLVHTSDYWKSHYAPGKESRKSYAKIGQSQIDLILINVVSPLRFAYGHFMNDEAIKMKAVELLMDIEAEKNSIIKKWQNTGVNIKSAFETQALLELYKNSCIHKKCLSCSIGTEILR